MGKAGDEMANIGAQLRIKTALNSRFPPSTKYHIAHGDQVGVYRERASRSEGPFRVTRTMEKEILVTDGRAEKQFNRSQDISDPGDSGNKKLRRLLSRFEGLKSGPPPEYS